MIQIGVRLHDVNTKASPEEQTMEARAARAKVEGFCCVHLAFSKVMTGIPTDDCALTEGFATYAKHVFEREGLDVAVLGCYLNLADPDPVRLKDIQSRYYANIRMASILHPSVVGTETGCPNSSYTTDGNTHTEEALYTFIRNLEPVVECAEHYGVSIAIEPVWKHIVFNADRALTVFESIPSKNLRIIFDPVNILYSGNVDTRDYVIKDAMDKLADRIAVVHFKDFERAGDELRSVSAGTGEMDYTEIMRFLKAKKPYIQCTLENSTNETAEFSKNLLYQVYDSV